MSCIKSKRSPRGQTLIGVVVTATIMAVLSVGFISMFRSQFKTTRNIAARGGAIDLSHGLDALFGSPQCATTGSSNYLFGGVSPVLISVISGPPSSYSVSIDTLNFANGTLAITSNSNAIISSLIHPYVISSISFSPLGANSSTMYPFQLKISFSDPNGGSPPLPLIKFITLFTNTTNQVVGACYSGGGGGTSHRVLTCTKVVPAWMTSYTFTASDCGGTLPNDTFLCAVSTVWMCNNIGNFQMTQPTASTGPTIGAMRNPITLPCPSTSNNNFQIVCISK